MAEKKSILITPEMTKSGVEALLSHDQYFYDVSETTLERFANEVYLAMVQKIPQRRSGYKSHRKTSPISRDRRARYAKLSR